MKRILLTMLVVTLLAGCNDTPPLPPTPTQKPVVLFEDGFNDGVDRPYNAVLLPFTDENPTRGSSYVANGIFTNISVFDLALTLIGQREWQSYSVQVKVRAGSYGLAGRYTNAGFYYIRVQPGMDSGTPTNSGRWELLRYDQPARWQDANNAKDNHVLASGTTTLPTNYKDWTTLGLTLVGSQITATINGKIVAVATDSTFKAGRVGLYNAGPEPVQFDDLLVTSAP